MEGTAISTAVISNSSDAILAGFSGWAEPWARLGLWVSLWNEQPELVEHTGPAGAFWKALIHHSHRYRNRLRQIACESQAGTPVTCEFDPLGGMLVIAVPLKHRNRVTGCLLTCGLLERFFDEENFARFCDSYRIDRTIFSRIAGTLPHFTETQLRSYAAILIHHVGTFNTAALAQREIRDLSGQLARTYEELNLLYRVSAGMSVSRPPSAHFEELCEDLLHTTVVKGLAVVLEPPRYLADKPTVIRKGIIEASTDEIVRLYQQIRDYRPNAGPAVVVDHVENDPPLAWASPWLRQLAFYPLARKDQHFGGVLALDHVDQSESNSSEIQFIAALVERSASFVENVQLYDDLEHLFSGLLHALVSSIDAKDPYTCGHSQRVAWLSRHIASLTGMPEPKCRRAYLSGLLHDVGKIGIPEAVLCKAGRLTPEEFQQMKQHPEIGARILHNVPQVADTIPGILYHHERMDGKGYPMGLAGSEIPLLGRIIGLADAYDAMTTNRTYRKARPIQVAIAEIRRCAGTQFDPEIADFFLRQDLQALHRELTEFGNTPMGPHLEMNAIAAGDII